ncbi:hypothetical protein B0H13DRAFT_2058248 [Mycena leptocephala]|nr:hypothetical protein B0H13DRAFT_2058248 [Mycena leptocephala]
MPRQKLAHHYHSGSDEAAGAKIWSVYIAEAEKYDRALVNSWKGDMEGILIFAGLFSSILTAFIIESYKNLSPDRGQATNMLLEQISQRLAPNSNTTLFEVSSSSTFIPAPISVICNGLWFLSLGLSLSSALVATFTTF